MVRKGGREGPHGAQFALASIYLDGSLGSADPETWRSLAGKAAEGGHSEALVNMGLMASGAFGKEPDWPEAADLVSQGSRARPCRGASTILASSISKAMAWSRNQVAAAEWFAKAAAQGLTDAALDYGVLVFRGEGVEKDEKIGAQWMLIAARRGNVVAQNRVARLYAFGRGVAADPVEALKWNLLAAKGGRPDAELDTLLAKLAAEQKAEAEARAAAFKPHTGRPDG